MAAPLAVALLAGCSETTVPPPGVYHPTLIGVAPEVFLASTYAGEPEVTPIPCVAAEGAMRTYVATVFNVEYLPDGSLVTVDDVASGDAVQGASDISGCHADAEPGTTPRATIGFALPSSTPIDCQNRVAISRVVEGHRYRAEVDGYDRDDLVPLAPGVRILVDPTTGERVEPRWKFSCGDTCPEHALNYTTRAVGDCTLLKDSAGPPSGPAGVLIAADALTGAPCGAGPGEVDHVELGYDAFGQSATVTAACGEAIRLDDVPVRGTLTMRVLAYEAGNPEPRWGTNCSALPIAGVTVSATCGPFHEQGALDVDPAQVLSLMGYGCADLATLPGELKLELTEGGGPGVRPATPPYVDNTTCGQSVRFSGITTGPASVEATLSSARTELGRVKCSADVVPGTAVPTDCSLED